MPHYSYCKVLAILPQFPNCHGCHFYNSFRTLLFIFLFFLLPSPRRLWVRCLPEFQIRRYSHELHRSPLPRFDKGWIPHLQIRRIDPKSRRSLFQYFTSNTRVQNIPHRLVQKLRVFRGGVWRSSWRSCGAVEGQIRWLSLYTMMLVPPMRATGLNKRLGNMESVTF